MKHSITRRTVTVEYSLPRSFVLFLSQVYGFIDESPEHANPPAVLLHMTLFGPRYDIRMAGAPLVAQRMQATLLRPLARLLGYHCYYERLAASQPAAIQIGNRAQLHLPTRLT